LVEVVRRGVGSPIRPEQLANSLAVDSMLGREGKQLDQALGLAQAPDRLRHLASFHLDSETAQQS
jgi:hypothetical protein